MRKDMIERLHRALKLGGDCYSLEDVLTALHTGQMQGHVIGDTWAITKVYDWPQKRSVEITFVVGEMHDAIQMEHEIEKFARSVGASAITAIGREGWWKIRTDGWKKMGTLYAKDIES